MPYVRGERMFRSLLSVSIAVILTMQVLAAAQQVLPQASNNSNNPKPSVIRSATRVVNVNVVVTDGEGRPVQGLTKDDFQILDSRQPEPIAFFSPWDRDDVTDGGSGPLPLAPGMYSNDPQRLGTPRQGATVILFDTVNTTYLSQAYSLGKIRTFLRQLQPEDRVGVYILSRDGLKIVYPPDQPAAALLETMQRYDEAHRGGGSKAVARAEESTGLVELDRFLRGKEDQRPLLRNGSSRCIPERFPITIAALQEIARNITGLRGRKAIIWVTERPPFSPLPRGEGNVFDLLPLEFCGMDYEPDLIVEEPANLKALPGSRRRRSPESGDSPSATGTGGEPTLDAVRDLGLGTNDELDLLIRLFNQNGITLYPVSGEGLQTVRLFGSGGMDNNAYIGRPEDMTRGELGAVDGVANMDAHQGMELMAQNTGGRAYYDRSDPESGIRRALDDGKYGYDLAYYPDHDRWNGDWHKIEVKVSRPGVTVLARRGYFAFPEAKLLPPKARKQLLEEIAASPLEDTEIPVKVKLTPPNSVASSTIEARVYLSAENLFASHQPDSWTSDFEVLFFQLTAKNKILDVTTQSVSLNFPQDKYSEALKRGINTAENLQFKPGAVLLYVIVHDKKTDAVGSVRIPLDQYAAAPQRTEPTR